MALRTVLKYPDPFLKETASPVEEVNDDIRELMDDMMETMHHEKGVGLAATQIGVGKRVIVLHIPDQREDDQEYDEDREVTWTTYKLANPEIISAIGETKYEEGCLSLPGINADVRRAAEVVLRAVDYEGKAVELTATGLLAIALQHEIDHLDGILFVFRVSRLKRELLLRRYRKLMASDAAV